jgi:hypothetical protein
MLCGSKRLWAPKSQPHVCIQRRLSQPYPSLATEDRHGSLACRIRDDVRCRAAIDVRKTYVASRHARSWRRMSYRRGWRNERTRGSQWRAAGRSPAIFAVT